MAIQLCIGEQSRKGKMSRLNKRKSKMKRDWQIDIKSKSTFQKLNVILRA